MMLEISKTRISIATFLSQAALHSLEGRILTLTFPKGCSFQKEIVESNKNLRFIKECLDKHLPENIDIKCIMSSKGDVSEDGKPEQKNSSLKIEDDKFITEILDTFKGNIHS